MREESHLDDMRAAIRGDFERLQERIGDQQLMRVDDPPPEEPPPEPVPEPSAYPLTEPEPPPPSDPEPEAEPPRDPEPEPEPQAEPTRSWVDRLLGR